MKKTLAEIPIRLQKIKLRLQPYDIMLSYKPGKFLQLADYLSRNYLKQKSVEYDDINCSVLLVQLKENMSIQRYEEFKLKTSLDKELMLVKTYILNGWPKTIKITRYHKTIPHL